MNTNELLRVMQAFLEGKTVQRRDSVRFVNHVNAGRSPMRPRREQSEWMDCTTEPTWDSARFEYRVKPAEPVQVSRLYLVDKDGDMWGVNNEINGYPFSTRRAADHAAIQYAQQYAQFAPFQVIELSGTYVKA